MPSLKYTPPYHSGSRESINRSTGTGSAIRIGSDSLELEEADSAWLELEAMVSG